MTGVICEYNPFHLGHQKQLRAIRALEGPEGGIVCLMSGSFVQRGAPAIFSKEVRAKAAILCGADLVLELPVNAALSSAEGFAARGVAILSPFCRQLCFGAETGSRASLFQAAQMLLSPDFPAALRRELDRGLSFPAARQQALEAMGGPGGLLDHPNDLLAVEYCKAILAQGAGMDILPIPRPGDYRADVPDPEDPSAASLRRLLAEGGPWQDFVPPEAAACFRGQAIHTLAAGERAMLARLRTMMEAEFAALPYGSEGLWRKLMHAARREASLEDVLRAVKSKRYTRTRLDRMALCAFLGLDRAAMEAPAPYVRVLALNARGRCILKEARSTGIFPNIGERMDSPWQETEDRTDALYGLFAQTLEVPCPRYRVFCPEE